MSTHPTAMSDTTPALLSQPEIVRAVLASPRETLRELGAALEPLIAECEFTSMPAGLGDHCDHAFIGHRRPVGAAWSTQPWSDGRELCAVEPAHVGL